MWQTKCGSQNSELGYRRNDRDQKGEQKIVSSSLLISTCHLITAYCREILGQGIGRRGTRARR